MGLPQRLRNIAVSQINAIKDRLDHLDAEAEVTDPRAELDARREIADLLPGRGSLRSPEEIAGGLLKSDATATTVKSTMSPLERHYRVLGLSDGATLADVKAAYAKLAARCSPARFDAGSEEAAAAADILQRIEDAYNALSDALDPTAGRFDKLEF
jgi:hypothetical protein